MSMYGRKTQLVDSAKAFLEKVVTWSNYIMQAVCDARQRMSSNLTARMTNGLTWCKQIIWRDKLESRGYVDGKTMDKNIVMIQRIYRGRLGRKEAEREWYNEQSFVERKRHTKDQTIDLTHALISSLPALNRGLYQAVTSHVVSSHVVRRLY